VAASKGRVEVRGVREVQTAMRRLEAQAGDLKAAHLAVASTLIPGIGIRSPVRSGALAASWSAGATKTRARITSSTRYAGVIEYGWPEHSIEPARMVRATVDVSHREILDAYERELARLAARDGFEVRDT
jgi:hypothetical protein